MLLWHGTMVKSQKLNRLIHSETLSKHIQVIHWLIGHFICSYFVHNLCSSFFILSLIYLKIGCENEVRMENFHFWIRLHNLNSKQEIILCNSAFFSHSVLFCPNLPPPPKPYKNKNYKWIPMYLLIDIHNLKIINIIIIY